MLAAPAPGSSPGPTPSLRFHVNTEADVEGGGADFALAAFHLYWLEETGSFEWGLGFFGLAPKSRFAPLDWALGDVARVQAAGLGLPSEALETAHLLTLRGDLLGFATQV